MKVQIAALAMMTAAGLAAPAVAGQSPFPDWCDDDQVAPLPAPSAADIAAHRRFTLPSLTYHGRLDFKPGFPLSFVVDKTGKVACIYQIGNPVTEEAAVLTPERLDVLRAASRWRYMPFLENGKPAQALISETIAETLLNDHTPMPAGRLRETRIELHSSGCYGTCPDYSVALSGDGEVVYEGNEFTDVAGRHAYTISPGEVAALIERLRGRDLWSMRDDYSAWITDGSSTVITMTIGGRRKTVRDYFGERAGMPEVVGLMQSDIVDISRAPGLVNLDADGLRILDAEGFDFKGKPGANLLVSTLQNERVADDIALAVLRRGAPVTGGDKPRDFRDYDEIRPERTALDAALLARRDALVAPILDAGALLTNGKPDQKRIDGAFQSAIFGGRLDFVERFAGYHPSLTYGSVDGHNEDGAAVTAPVTLLLYRGGAIVEDREDRPDQDFAIARFLISLGCDINAKDAGGMTLLMVAATGNGEADFVRWLLDHGADIKAVNKDGDNALNKTYDEDVALVLLEAGADPEADPQYHPGFLFYAQDWQWTRVIAWLEAHGYGEQLKANATAVDVVAPVAAASGTT